MEKERTKDSKMGLNATWSMAVGGMVGGGIFSVLGVGEAAGLEIVTVWAKLAILVGLAGFGLWLWQPERLIQGTEPKGFLMALVAAASIFMAYGGFQLLSYDYEDIRDPDT